MNIYNPSIPPKANDWLELDEQTRLELLYDFVENYEQEKEAMRIHAAIHMIVENQLALNIELTTETYNRLKRQGLDRHQIIHAIGSVISEDIFELMKGNKENPFEGQKFRLKKTNCKTLEKRQILMFLFNNQPRSL